MYHIIIEALDDIITTSSNPGLVACRDTILETASVYQVTFLEDVLSITNILSLLLQSDKRFFCYIIFYKYSCGYFKRYGRE